MWKMLKRFLWWRDALTIEEYKAYLKDRQRKDLKREIKGAMYRTTRLKTRAVHFVNVNHYPLLDTQDVRDLMGTVGHVIVDADSDKDAVLWRVSWHTRQLELEL